MVTFRVTYNDDSYIELMATEFTGEVLGDVTFIVFKCDGRPFTYVRAESIKHMSRVSGCS